MDPVLRALCMEVLVGDVDSERFGWLLMETGVNCEGLEWDVATKLVGQGEVVGDLTRKFGDTIH